MSFGARKSSFGSRVYFDHNGLRETRPLLSGSAIADSSDGQDERLLLRQAESVDNANGSLQPRRRRSSMAQQWDHLRQMGGVNSLDNFARSYQRAASFREFRTPKQRSVVVQPLLGNDADITSPRGSRRRIAGRPPLESILSHQLSEGVDQFPVPDDDDPSDRTVSEPSAPYGQTLLNRTPSGRSDSFARSNYGTLPVTLGPAFQRRATILSDEQYDAAKRATEAAKFEGEYQQRRLELHDEDGETVVRVVGDSTVPMTIGNTVNALVGIGLLALPLGLSYSGWILGAIIFTISAIVTNYTAVLLTKCLDTNTGSMTYGDISFLAYGSWGRRCVETIFLFELTVAATGIVVLFGDSMNQLIPALSRVAWQCVITIGLLPLNFVPFRYLSITSILGVLCTMGLITLITTDGIIKPEQPGSLRQIAHTSLLPNDFRAVPLSIGLFMSPWGGHAVIPAIYRDMRHPRKFKKAAGISYGTSYILDAFIAAIGYLMFGHDMPHAVTTGILKSKAYPKTISLIIIFLIASVCITKLPLITRPLIDTIGSKFGNHDAEMSEEDSLDKPPSRAGYQMTAGIINLVILALAIAFPEFDSIMALLGAAFCITICIILPTLFYLRIFPKDSVSLVERTLCWVLIVVSAVLAVLGTVYAVLPREKLGLK